MKIYIAKDYKGRPLGLILAKGKAVAEGYFYGKYGAFDSIEIQDPNDPDLGTTFPFRVLIETEAVLKSGSFLNEIDHRKVKSRGN